MASSSGERVKGEPRWPMTLAVVSVISLTMALPERLTSGPRWIFPSGMAILLVALIATDPGAITKTSKVLRGLSIALVLLMVLSALVSTVILIKDLIEVVPQFQNGTTLLTAGGSVWLINILAFALLYWEFDGGGPAARAYRMPASPDFAFRKIVLPAALPHIFTSLRIALGLAWVTIVVAELIDAKMPSLGYLLTLAGAYPRVPTMVVGIATIGALVLLFDLVAMSLHFGATRWMRRAA